MLTRRTFLAGCAALACAPEDDVITLTTSVRSAYGLSQLRAKAMYQSAANIQLAPRCWAAAFKMLAVSSTTRALISNLSSGGFDLRVNANEGITARIVDGSAATQSKAHSTALTVDGAIHLAFGQYQGHGGSGVLQVALDRGAFQASASLTGYTAAPTAAMRFGCDTAASTSPADDLEVFGFAYADTVQTEGEWQTWCDSVKAAKALVPFVAGTSRVWNTQCSMRNLNPRITWTSDDGAVAMALSANTGATFRPKVTRYQSPTWGW